MLPKDTYILYIHIKVEPKLRKNLYVLWHEPNNTPINLDYLSGSTITITTEVEEGEFQVVQRFKIMDWE